MKKACWLLAFLLLMPLSLAQTDNLYLLDSLKLKLQVDASFQLIAESSDAELQNVSANLLLYPKDDYRQQHLSLESSGTEQQNSLIFVWEDGKIEEKQFGYIALVQTQNERIPVKNKITFPLPASYLAGMEEFLEPTVTIDSNNPEVIAQATELAEGEDDLFKVAFKLASWVEENVEYNLNTATVKASQKASWVLKHRQGVCDEMTSLFVAMCRSLGIPAKFVSGISYSNLDEFKGQNWQPHGWAEVYFPDIGWISFDIAFGEYGYIDVTHIKLKEESDPKDPAVEYQWLAKDVTLESQPLDFAVIVTDKGIPIQDEFTLEPQVLDENIGFGSYNLITATITNNANYYSALTLKLAVPSEVEVISKNKKNILLAPKESKEVSWIVKIPEALDENYVYEFPYSIYSEKNVTVSGVFQVQSGLSYYSRSDIEELSAEEESKVYSQKISFKCNYPSEIKLGEEGKIICTIKNTGNINLDNLDFCLGKVCDLVSLPLNQESSSEITVQGDKAGWQKVLVSAENELVKKSQYLEYRVLDTPEISIEVSAPEMASYGENFLIGLKLNKESFSNPKNLLVTVSGPGFSSEWQSAELKKNESVSLDLEGTRLSFNNKFKLKAVWQDQDGNDYSLEKDIAIKGKSVSFSQKIKMALNWLLGLLV